MNVQGPLWSSPGLCILSDLLPPVPTHPQAHPSHLEPQVPYQARPLSVCSSCLGCVDALLPPLRLLAAFIVILEGPNTTSFVKSSLTSSSA